MAEVQDETPVDSTHGASPTKSKALEQSFAAALEAARRSPVSADAWDHLEELADTLQRPDEVSGLYREILGERLESALREELSRRAVAFHEEWFGDAPETMDALLGQILATDPDATWAFDRLTVVLTVAQRWDDLLALYDRTLQQVTDAVRRRRLLDDAAHVAKDFAGQPGRAVDYLQALLDLQPTNAKLAGAIERLLERGSRWEDLIDLWQARLSRMAPDEARATRVRIAACFIDKLEAATPALEELRALVEESPGHPEGCAQLERIVDFDGADLEIRIEALSLLRTNYDVAGRSADFVAVLERAIELPEGDTRDTLRREAAQRLAILGRDEEAMRQYAALLAARPTDTDARKQLRQIDKRSGLAALHADALVTAAEAADDDTARIGLIIEAADLAADQLDDRPRGIELYERALSLSEADPALGLVAAHRAGDLLSDSEDGERRLAVLEKLAVLERSAAVRRTVLGVAAELAAELGDTDRALANWNQRLSANTSDFEALDAVVSVLDRAERWDELVQALQRRAEATPLPQQRRIDLIWIAKIHEERRGVLDEAIDGWRALKDEYGDDAEAVSALDRLLTGTGRNDEASQVVQEAAQARRLSSAELLGRLGDILVGDLSRDADAARAYAQTLGVDPSDERARQGLVALVQAHGHADAGQSDVARAAAEALAVAYRLTEDWDGLLGLVDVRVEHALDPRDAVRVLREAASLAETKRGDMQAAQRSVARALVLDPSDTGLEHEVVRLAETTGQWAEVATTYRNAIEQSGPSPARAAHLYRAEGRVLEERLSDPAAAARGYAAAAELEPESLETQRALIRVAARAGQWAQAAKGAVALSTMRSAVDDSVDAIATAAGELGAWSELAGAVAEALQGAELPRELGRALHAIVARWYADRAADVATAAAQAEIAVEHDPRHGETLRLLAKLQREAATASLPATLIRIDGLSDDDLDALWEASEVLVADAPAGDEARDVLEKLYRKAARLLSRGMNAAGTRSSAEAVRRSLEQLVEASLNASENERAVSQLLGAAMLPLPREETLAFQVRAARLLVELQRRRKAIDLLTHVLQELPEDIGLVRELATLCEEEDRILELITLRRRELELTSEAERRLDLGLELSRLGGAVEGRAGRVDALVANLEVAPGHPASIEALVAVLSERGKYERLAELLTRQAHTLEGLDRAEDSAQLWTRVAGIVETHLSDLDRAIAALERVVELSATNAAFDDLARLHLLRDEPAEAAAWLHKRLSTTEEAHRVAVLLRLARAQLAADQEDAAVGSLQAAFAQAPRNGEVRKLLLGLYRRREQWEELAKALATAAEHVGDTKAILAYAREAAEIYHERLDMPDQAVPVLERAHSLAPDDRRLRSQLAEGLRVAGRLDDARALLTGLITDFGRRRSPERARVHLQLGLVAHAQADNAEALDQLENAAKMDSKDPTIMRTLAELARETGQYDRAEGAYRALLLQLRRAEPDEGAERIGASEVLIELSAIAAERGQAEQAEELVESSLEALAHSDAEAPRLQQLLYERGDYTLLQRVLQTRLSHADGPRRRAMILGDLAELQENHLDDAAGALRTRLQAVEDDPGSPNHHDAARGLAARLERLDDYVAVLDTQMERARRNTDLQVRCELVLRMGEALEERGDHDRAAELYAQAQEMGVREVDVCRALARLAGARGDTATQMQLLEQLVALGGDETETRSDALYRMAEVQLASPESVVDGIESLRRALADSPHAERAARILDRATADAVPHDELLDLFDQVARKTGDGATLLAAIERRAAHPDVQPEYVREGVELATSRDEHDRAEALMMRAVELGGSVLDGETRVAWAMLGLARRRHETGDLAGAIKWLGEAAEAAEPAALFELGRAVATTAMADGGDPSLAAKLYETLLERDPTARDAWEPLAGLYRQLGDTERLHRLVDETLDGLSDATDRNALRLQLVQARLANEDTDEALEILRGVLLEDPEHEQAQQIMAEHLERTGRHEELDALLQQRLMAAQSRSDTEAIVDTALALAQRLVERDPAQAMTALEAAMSTAPDDARVVDALLGHLTDPEHRTRRAELLERRLSKESGDEAARLALELASLHEALEDEEAVMAALMLGQRRAPGHEQIRHRLEQAYESRGDYRGLAQMLTAAAESEPDETVQVSLLRQAATIHRDLLSDASTAAALLEDAHRRAPEEPTLTMDLASALASAEDVPRACDLVSELLSGAGEDHKLQLRLHMMRGDLQSGAGDLDSAITDYEAALLIDVQTAAPSLVGALRAKREGAVAAENPDAERASTLRLVEVLLEQDATDDARTVLGSWVENNRKDTTALQLLRRLDEREGNWEAVAKTCARLVAVESDEAQAEAAVALAEAWEQMGQPGEARAGLEHARRKQPDNRDIRDRLERIYEATDAHKELAKLLVQRSEEIEDEQERLPLLQRIGELYVTVGEVEEALPILQKILDLAPEDVAAAATLADAYTAVGELDKAMSVVDRGLAILGTRRTPELALMVHRKARIAGARGDSDQQVELLQQAFLADKTNGQVAAELADLAEALEEYDLAVKVLRTITLLDDCPISRVQAFLRQAKIAGKRGDRQRAVLWARKARHESPDNAEVLAYLEELGE